MRNFCEFHSHPKSLDSASTPEKFAAKELELGTGHITCTDHGTMEATRTIYDLTKTKEFSKLKPILGLEAYVRDDDDALLIEAGIPRSKDGTFRDYLKYTHLTLHCKDEAAYSAMSRILSAADLRAERHGSELKPLFNWANIEELGALNVSAGSSCLIGMVSRHLLVYRDVVMAEKYYQKLRSSFKPGNFFVELFPHVCDRNWESKVLVTDTSGKTHDFRPYKKLKTLTGGDGLRAEELAQQSNPAKNHKLIVEVMENRVWKVLPEPIFIATVEKKEGFIVNECHPFSPDGDVQLSANLFLYKMAKKYGDNILVSGDSHFTVPEEKIVQDVRLGQSGSWKMANSYHRQSSADAFAYFKAKMGTSEAEFESWVENSYQWAAGFDDFKFTNKASLPVSFYPKDTLGHTMALIKKHGRMNWSDPRYVERLNKEIELLHKNGTTDLLTYFMVDEEVCHEYTKQKIMQGPGRGCFTPKNIVQTPTGKKEIQDIQVGDLVISHDSTVNTVTHKLCYEISEEVFLIETEDGRTIECTFDHKILTKRGWVMAKDLTTEDDIVEV